MTDIIPWIQRKRYVAGWTLWTRTYKRVKNDHRSEWSLSSITAVQNELFHLFHIKNLQVIYKLNKQCVRWTVTLHTQRTSLNTVSSWYRQKHLRSFVIFFNFLESFLPLSWIISRYILTRKPSAANAEMLPSNHYWNCLSHSSCLNAKEACYKTSHLLHSFQYWSTSVQRFLHADCISSIVRSG